MIQIYKYHYFYYFFCLELYKVLNDHELLSLYPKFAKANVKADIVWNLNNEMLDEAGLSKIEKLQYRRTQAKLFQTTQLGANLQTSLN